MNYPEHVTPSPGLRAYLLVRDLDRGAELLTLDHWTTEQSEEAERIERRLAALGFTLAPPNKGATMP